MKRRAVVLVDYTKKRLNSRSERGLRIGRCSKCGRKGEHIKYRDGGESFHHIVTDGPIPTITDSCFISSRCACRGTIKESGAVHGAESCEYSEPGDQRDDECDIEAYERRQREARP